MPRVNSTLDKQVPGLFVHGTVVRRSRRSIGAPPAPPKTVVTYGVNIGDSVLDVEEWQQIVTEHFPASLRTAQKYMRLARHFRLIQANSPQALSSQNQAAKSLTAIMNGGQPDTPMGGSKRKRRARGASLIIPGPFFEMAIQTLRDVEHQLAQVRPDSYPVAAALAAVRRGTSALPELSTASGEVRDEPVSGFRGGTGHAPHSANSNPQPRGDGPQRHLGESNERVDPRVARALPRSFKAARSARKHLRIRARRQRTRPRAIFAILANGIRGFAQIFKGRYERRSAI